MRLFLSVARVVAILCTLDACGSIVPSAQAPGNDLHVAEDASRESLSDTPLGRLSVPTSYGQVRSALVPSSWNEGGSTPGAGGQGGFAFGAPPIGDTFLAGAAVHEFRTGEGIVLGSALDALDAPTTHWPGQCFEIGSRFEGEPSGAGSHGSLFVYDYCKPHGSEPGTFVAELPFDASFEATFVSFNAATAESQYEVGAARIGFGSEIAPVIYLQPSGEAQTIVGYHGESIAEPLAATPTRIDGWSIFKTHYRTPAPACPNVPTLYATGIAYGLTVGSNGLYRSPADLSPDLYRSGNCFSVGAHSGYDYSIAVPGGTGSSWMTSSARS